MTRPNVIERTEGEVIELNTQSFFQRAHAEIGPISAGYAGKYVNACLVVTSVAITEAQMNTLENAITAIAGVDYAHVAIGPARIPADRVPVGDDLYLEIEGGFDVRPQAN